VIVLTMSGNMSPITGLYYSVKLRELCISSCWLVLSVRLSCVLCLW